MNLKRSIYLLGNQLLNYISGRFNFEERRNWGSKWRNSNWQNIVNLRPVSGVEEI